MEYERAVLSVDMVKNYSDVTSNTKIETRNINIVLK